jgi:DNA-binding NtrC family response regulator
MPLSIQAKLLRAIETNEIQPVGSTRRIPIGARIVTATNRELKAEAAAGRFREDLYFRLAVVEIQVPPLRERREDIPLLANHFVLKYARELGRDVRGISRDALRLLVGHEWRGNIRELSNSIERAVIFASTTEIVPNDLPESFRSVTPRDADYSPQLDAATREFERSHILKVIEQCGGNKRKAAKMLGIGATSLYRKLGDPAEAEEATE